MKKKKNVWSKLVSLAALSIALWLIGWDTPVKLVISALIAIAWQLMFSAHKREISDMRMTLDGMRDDRDRARRRADGFNNENQRLHREYDALLKGRSEEQIPVDMTNIVEGVAYHVLEFNRGAEVKLKPVGVTRNIALAADYVAAGFRVEVVPVWVLPDGRVAWRKAGRNSLEISIIRTLENAQ